MTERIRLDEIVDPFAAQVVVTRDAAGQVVDARFDLSGLPRVDGLLVGRPVVEVPGLVERLCGICPAAHHLAGMRALESLRGLTKLPAVANRSRRLLHHGAVLEAHAARVLPIDVPIAADLRRFARDAMAVVGARGHFPAVAVPGGIAQPVDDAGASALAEGGPGVLATAERIAEQLLATDPPLAEFAGLDLALVDPTGAPDLLGSRLSGCDSDRRRVLDRAQPAAWSTVVAERFPHTPAPRPYLVALGPVDGRYRVGPVAQLRLGTLTTPRAARLQERWLATGAGAASARAVMAVHAIEVICHEAVHESGTTIVADPAPLGPGTGVGWVDGPRGLLVHSYTAGADGMLQAASILTPTAQNESWLAALLADLFAADGAPEAPAVEASIRTADPCLPVTMAPAGGMGVDVRCV